MNFDVGDALQRAVQAQEDFLKARAKKEFQEKVDAIRFQIAEACGHEVGSMLVSKVF